MFCKIEFRIEINSQYLPDIDWPFDGIQLYLRSL
jgi:hypothetical protein